MRTAMLAAAMTSAPVARPVVALLPPVRMIVPQVDVTTEFEAVPPSEAYEEMIQDAAAEYDMDPALIRAVMQTESAFHPYAVSRAGAEGLMQLMPELADEMGVTNAFDPRENIRGGVRYLKRARPPQGRSRSGACQLQRRPRQRGALRRGAALQRDARLRQDH